MSYIRKNIQQAKLYEDDLMFELECQKREIIAKERIWKAIVIQRVVELANSPEWVDFRLSAKLNEKDTCENNIK